MDTSKVWNARNVSNELNKFGALRFSKLGFKKKQYYCVRTSTNREERVFFQHAVYTPQLRLYARGHIVHYDVIDIMRSYSPYLKDDPLDFTFRLDPRWQGLSDIDVVSWDECEFTVPTYLNAIVDVLQEWYTRLSTIDRVDAIVNSKPFDVYAGGDIPQAKTPEATAAVIGYLAENRNLADLCTRYADLSRKEADAATHLKTPWSRRWFDVLYEDLVSGRPLRFSTDGHHPDFIPS
jgi:hypothetical protein